MQTGLIDYWDLWFRPMPLQCLDNIKSVYKPQNSKTLKMKNRPPALTLKNLTGAFIVLLLGFSLSFLAFLCERIISIPIRRSRQLQKSRTSTAVNSPNQRELANVENQNWLAKNHHKGERTVNSRGEFGNQSILINQEMGGCEDGNITVEIQTEFIWNHKIVILFRFCSENFSNPCSLWSSLTILLLLYSVHFILINK